MKILITGIAGAIGSNAAERFAALGHEVYGIDSFNSYYDPALKELTARELEKQDIKIIRADLAADDISERIDKDTDFIFHFAAQPGISAHTTFETYVRSNLLATERLLEVAGHLPSLSSFIFISTSSVYGAYANGDETNPATPSSIYGVTKLAAEQLALAKFRNHTLPVTALRLFSVYGERERPDKLYRKLIEAIDKGETFPLHEGSREHLRSYTYVGDVVDAFVSVIDRAGSCSGEIFNIGTDKIVSTGEGIDLVEELMGKKAKFENKAPRSGDQFETAAHIDKARRILGYEPKTTLREGLTKEVEWYRRSVSSI